MACLHQDAVPEDSNLYNISSGYTDDEKSVQTCVKSTHYFTCDEYLVNSFKTLDIANGSPHGTRRARQCPSSCDPSLAVVKTLPTVETSGGSPVKSSSQISPINHLIYSLSTGLSKTNVNDMKLLLCKLDSQPASEYVSIPERDMPNGGAILKALRQRRPDDDQYLDLLCELFHDIGMEILVRRVDRYRQAAKGGTSKGSPTSPFLTFLDSSSHITKLNQLPSDSYDPLRITSKKTLYRTEKGFIIVTDSNKNSIVCISKPLWEEVLEMRSITEEKFQDFKKSEWLEPVSALHVFGCSFVTVDFWKKIKKCVLHLRKFYESHDGKLQPGDVGVCFIHENWEQFIDYLRYLKDSRYS